MLQKLLRIADCIVAPVMSKSPSAEYRRPCFWKVWLAPILSRFYDVRRMCGWFQGGDIKFWSFHWLNLPRQQINERRRVGVSEDESRWTKHGTGAGTGNRSLASSGAWGRWTQRRSAPTFEPVMMMMNKLYWSASRCRARKNKKAKTLQRAYTITINH